MTPILPDNASNGPPERRHDPHSKLTMMQSAVVHWAILHVTRSRVPKTIFRHFSAVGLKPTAWTATEAANSWRRDASGGMHDHWSCGPASDLSTRRLGQYVLTAPSTRSACRSLAIRAAHSAAGSVAVLMKFRLLDG